MVLTMASIRGALGDLVNGGGDKVDREATKHVGGDGGGNTVTSKQKSSPLQDSSRSVVMIETDRGASWASGVVLNTGGERGRT